MPKYLNDQNGILSDDLYFEVFQKKEVKFLKIRRSNNFKKMQDMELEIGQEHIWSQGDTLFRLANKYYGSYELWWTIGLINNKPTDGHYKVGDLVYIISNPLSIKDKMR